MFSESAEFYDLIYGAMKDYAAEARAIAELLRRTHPQASTVLDVACGTGEHARLLAAEHGFRVDGVDLDPAFVRIAAAKNPSGRFERADMAAFELGRRYDAVLCLFSSIGYVRTEDRLRGALACFRDHLAPGGVVIVEPWFRPDTFSAGQTTSKTIEAEGLRIVRTSATEVVGRLSRVRFDYRIEGPEGLRQATEIHELGLFTVEEMMAAFAAARLAVDHDPQGLTGRGLYIARAEGVSA